MDLYKKINPKPDTKESPKTNSIQFLAIDTKTSWIWFQEELSYLFIPISQIVEIKLVPATNNSINIYARLNLNDRFEYKMIENKKTLAAARKYVENFVMLLQSCRSGSSNKSIEQETEEPKKTEKNNINNLDGFEALKQLVETLKK